jgi:hypothetical protein
MPCRTLRTSHGLAIACSREGYPKPRRCVVCNQPETMTSIKLCDFEVRPGQTCDAVLCLVHTFHVCQLPLWPDAAAANDPY